MDIILNTFGTALNRDNEGFVISNKDGRQRVPVQGIRSIQVGRGAQITSDAILMAIEHEIEVIFTDRTGDPKGRIWSSQYGSISTIRKGQLAFTASSRAMSWIRDVLVQKVSNQQAILLMLPDTGQDADNAYRERAIARLEEFRNKLQQVADGNLVADVAAQLRGYEGSASKIYFDTICQFIPEQYRFEGRSQHPAMDVFNALLNYGYGIMYGRIEGELIKAGIDPYIGVLHRDEYNRPVLVYDVIELYRAWVDYVVCNLVCQRIINDEYFSKGEDGSCWLEPLGRRVLIQSVNDYLEELVEVKNLTRSRSTQIQLYAQNLAQTFKQFQ